MRFLPDTWPSPHTERTSLTLRFFYHTRPKPSSTHLKRTRIGDDERQIGTTDTCSRARTVEEKFTESHYLMPTTTHNTRSLTNIHAPHPRHIHHHYLPAPCPSPLRQQLPSRLPTQPRIFYNSPCPTASPTHPSCASRWAAKRPRRGVAHRVGTRWRGCGAGSGRTIGSCGWI